MNNFQRKTLYNCQFTTKTVVILTFSTTNSFLSLKPPLKQKIILNRTFTHEGMLRKNLTIRISF